MKTICSRNSQKPFWLYKFSGKNVSMLCQKKYLPYTISWRPRTAFLKHVVSKCCFRDIVGFYRVGLGKDWIIFLRRLAVWALQNVLQFFILIEIFENSTSFSILIHLFIALKRWNFPDNLDFKGKIVAKVLIKSRFLSI